ncbi:hypothetical protein AB0395_44815 [Streptosporangium sp. NPDC051023]
MRFLSPGKTPFTDSGEAQSVRDAYDAQWDAQKNLPVVAPKGGTKGGKK